MSDVRLLSAVPQFAVPDLVRTAEHYRDRLGFRIQGYWDGERVTHAPDPAHPPVFAIVSRDDVRIHFNAGQTARNENGYDAYIHLTGVDALAQELRERGADIVDEPEDRVYGQRELVVRDCNGLVLAFGEATG